MPWGLGEYSLWRSTVCITGFLLTVSLLSVTQYNSLHTIKFTGRGEHEETASSLKKTLFPKALTLKFSRLNVQPSELMSPGFPAHLVSHVSIPMTDLKVPGNLRLHSANSVLSPWYPLFAYGLSAL